MCTPTRMRNMTTMQQSQNLFNEALTNSKLRHRRRPLITWAHQRQHLWQRQQHCMFLLIALILLQQVEVHTCHQLTKRGNRKLDSTNELSSSSFSSRAEDAVDSQNFDSPISKRNELAHDGRAGQPEEIFTVDDQIESNYDEYPMIVPKRAALLLDRLMVALNHALEQERNKEQQNVPLNLDNMYGDDPTVLVDYDFKDLNSINGASGETLMGKAFQRRANFGVSDGIALLKSALTSGSIMKGSNKDMLNAVSGGAGGSSLNGGRINTGRMYWRCYFNAVTCF